MENIESLIQGSEKLTRIFGYWPSFHDAEIIDLHFWRGVVEPDQGRYDFPVLTLKIHVWELTNDVNSNGFLVLKHHTITTLRFFDVDELPNGRVQSPECDPRALSYPRAACGRPLALFRCVHGPCIWYGRVVQLSPGRGRGRPPVQ